MLMVSAVAILPGCGLGSDKGGAVEEEEQRLCGVGENKPCREEAVTLPVRREVTDRSVDVNETPLPK
jgi:hypothetical protein